MDQAINMVVPVFFGLFVGLWLDKNFNFTPLFTIGLTLLGVATGIYSVIKQAYKEK